MRAFLKSLNVEAVENKRGKSSARSGSTSSRSGGISSRGPPAQSSKAPGGKVVASSKEPPHIGMQRSASKVFGRLNSNTPLESPSHAEEISITNRILKTAAPEALSMAGSKDKKSVGAGGESAAHRIRMSWKRALQKFEKFRITRGHSIQTFFAVLNPRNYEALPIRLFASALSEYCPDITFNEALSFGIACDVFQRMEVSVKDIVYLQSAAAESFTISQLLEGHPIFPEWLATRDDFQHYFSEWEEGKGAPSQYAIEEAIITKPDDRTQADIQVIFNWMKHHRILMQVNNKTLVEICKKVFELKVKRGATVFKENDVGDAFYAVVAGTVAVFIAGELVKTLDTGSTFGELALERSVLRSATIVASTDSQLMTLLSSDYSKLTTQAFGSQTTTAKASNLLVEFISNSCPALRSLDIKSITQMVHRAKTLAYCEGDQIALQDEPCTCLCLVIKGRVRIMRRISTAGVIDNAQFMNPGGFHEHSKLSGSISVVAGNLGPGSVFGEEFLRNRHRYTYSAIALEEPTDVVFIPKSDAMEALDKKSKQQILSINRDLYQSDLDILLRQEALIRTKLVDPIRVKLHASRVTTAGSASSDSLPSPGRYVPSPSMTKVRLGRGEGKTTTFALQPIELSTPPPTDTVSRAPSPGIISEPAPLVLPILVKAKGVAQKERR